MNIQSRKRCKRRFVPWFNSAEWGMVYKLIYGPENNVHSQIEALNILEIWKCRTPLLHSGVEGTLIILRAILFDGNQDSYNIRLVQSTSIMRFLNICAAYDKKQGTFYQTAKKRKIPEWIISLRHDAAHSQDLPMPDILSKALQFCLNWLYENYWLPVSSTITDYMAKPGACYQDYEDLKSTLEPFVTNYKYLTIAKHPNWNYSKIGDIADENLRTALKNDISELLGDKNIVDDIKLTYVLKFIWLKIEKILQSNSTKKKLFVLPQLLLEGELFLGNMEEYSSDKETSIPKSFLLLWEKILTSMQNFGMIPALLEKLLDEVENEQNGFKRRQVAALWIAEIGKAYIKSIFAQNLYKDLLKKIITNKMTAGQINKKLKSDCEQKMPKFQNVLTLNLLTDVPAIITNSENFRNLFLKKPNEFTNIFLPTLLELCEAFKNTNIKKKIIELNNIYTNTESKSASNEEKIYTLKNLLENISEDSLPETSKKFIETNNDTESPWKLVTDIDFTKCPIGILPWQTFNKNHLFSINNFS